MLIDYFVNLLVEAGLSVLGWLPLEPALPLTFAQGSEVGLMIGQAFGVLDALFPVSSAVAALTFLFGGRALMWVVGVVFTLVGMVPVLGPKV